MKKIDKFKKRTNNYLYDHIYLKTTLSYGKSAIICTIAALIYAFAFVCFITPAQVNPVTLQGSSIVTGGVGGIVQVLHLIFKVCGLDVDAKFMQTIGYFVLNVPLIIFAFFKIGRKFALVTLINVGLSSLFIEVLKNWDLVNQIVAVIADQHVARTLFSGALVGFSSAIAFKTEGSCGGIDIVSYYFAMRKSTNVGKYTASLNVIIFISYSILSIIIGNGGSNAVAVLNIFFSILYTFVTTLTVDVINTKNKKAQIQIITENPSISAILISNFPHSTTTVEAHGGYSHRGKDIVYIVVSSNEVKKVINIVRIADPQSFITVTSLHQVYGSFYIKPVE